MASQIPHESEPPVVFEPSNEPRWTFDCMDDDCSTDTYGYESHILAFVEEHVRETGHEVRASKTVHGTLKLGASAGSQEPAPAESLEPCADCGQSGYETTRFGGTVGICPTCGGSGYAKDRNAPEPHNETPHNLREGSGDTTPVAPSERERVIREQVDRYEPDLRDLAKADRIGADGPAARASGERRKKIADGRVDGASPVRDDRTCTEAVNHGDMSDPCEKPAVGWRIDPNHGGEYEVCAEHYRPPFIVADQERLVSELARVQDELKAQSQALEQARMEAEWVAAVNEALGADRGRCAFVDDAVRLVVRERDQAREALGPAAQPETNQAVSGPNLKAGLMAIRGLVLNPQGRSERETLAHINEIVGEAVYGDFAGAIEGAASGVTEKGDG